MKYNANNRLKLFSEFDIGLEKNSIRLAAFNPKWKRLFATEAYFIFDTLRMESLRMYHCGSTAVEGLDAKPILDIIAAVPTLEEIEQQQDKLASIGYACQGEYGIPERRFFILENPDKSIRYVHLHVFKHNDPTITKHLQLRDYLRNSNEARTTYLQHKKAIINQQVTRANYHSAKKNLIEALQHAAAQVPIKPKICAILGAAEGHKNTIKFLQDTYDGIEIIDLNTVALQPYSYLDTADNAENLITKLSAFDLIVLATPVYWYAMSSAMKIFIDNLTNLVDGQSTLPKDALYGKKMQLLATGADTKLPLGFEVPFLATATYLGMDYLGTTYKSTAT